MDSIRYESAILDNYLNMYFIENNIEVLSEKLMYQVQASVKSTPKQEEKKKSMIRSMFDKFIKFIKSIINKFQDVFKIVQTWMKKMLQKLSKVKQNVGDALAKKVTMTAVYYDLHTLDDKTNTVVRELADTLLKNSTFKQYLNRDFDSNLYYFWYR
jgi:hypothetical protein